METDGQFDDGKSSTEVVSQFPVGQIMRFVVADCHAEVPSANSVQPVEKSPLVQCFLWSNWSAQGAGC